MKDEEAEASDYDHGEDGGVMPVGFGGCGEGEGNEN